jgi:hypothetical protein
MFSHSLTDTVTVLEAIETIRSPFLQQMAFTLYGKAIGKSPSELKRLLTLYQQSR